MCFLGVKTSWISKNCMASISGPVHWTNVQRMLQASFVWVTVHQGKLVSFARDLVLLLLKYTFYRIKIPVSSWITPFSSINILAALISSSMNVLFFFPSSFCSNKKPPWIKLKQPLWRPVGHLPWSHPLSGDVVCFERASVSENHAPAQLFLQHHCLGSGCACHFVRHTCLMHSSPPTLLCSFPFPSFSVVAFLFLLSWTFLLLLTEEAASFACLSESSNGKHVKEATVTTESVVPTH